MNKLLSVDKVSKNMVLPAKVESREAKGFIVDLGFKDNTKGFLKVAEQTDTSTLVGKRVYIVVKTIIASSKIIKCELLNKDNKLDCVQQAAVESNLDDNFKLTAAQMKPGYLVHSKVSNVLVNGVELTYLGGLTGTVFEDHLDPNVKDLKVGSKLDARIVSVDPITKKVTLSTLPHIVNWSPDTKNSKTLPKIGETF
jgi:ribosomal protein S1